MRVANYTDDVISQAKAYFREMDDYILSHPIKVDDVARVAESPADDEAGTIAQYGDDFGKMGVYTKNPGVKVDWSQYAEHGFEKMTERGLTKNMIESIVQDGKVITQNGGSKFAYITQEGVAVVSKEGKLITAWGKNNFDTNMSEIVTKLFGK